MLHCHTHAVVETVGKRIQRIAKERGLPGGKALAKLFGVTYETLRSWSAEGGRMAPNRARALKIAGVLGVPVEVVMYGAPARSRAPDAEAIADAFDALPVDSERALDRREWLYTSIMAQIAKHAAEQASAPAPQPAETPSA